MKVEHVAGGDAVEAGGECKRRYLLAAQGVDQEALAHLRDEKTRGVRGGFGQLDLNSGHRELSCAVRARKLIRIRRGAEVVMSIRTRSTIALENLRAKGIHLSRVATSKRRSLLLVVRKRAGARTSRP
jgi:hypothetical protein